MVRLSTQDQICFHICINRSAKTNSVQNVCVRVRLCTHRALFEHVVAVQECLHTGSYAT